MGLLSIFKSRSDAPSAAASAGEPGDAVQRARTRARQRLIGAVVLVGIGIVGFPLVFETQPRPIPVDIPIEVPRKEGSASLTMPAARPPGANSSASAAQVQPVTPKPSGGTAATNDVATETPEDAGRDVAAAPEAAASKPAAKTAPIADSAKPAVEAKPAKATAAVKPDAESKPAAPSAADSARAKSLLEGKAPAAADSGRFVLQVGAFADAGAAHETRLKVEKLGMKTYTQVVSTSAGSRIRVRVGPFATRDEADSALAKARNAGLTAVVLTL